MCRINGIKNVRETLRRMVIHYSMKKIKDLLFDEEDLESGLLVEDMDPWKCLEEVDLSFNEIKCFDESMASFHFIFLLMIRFSATSP